MGHQPATRNPHHVCAICQTPELYPGDECIGGPGCRAFAVWNEGYAARTGEIVAELQRRVMALDAAANNGLRTKVERARAQAAARELSTFIVRYDCPEGVQADTLIGQSIAICGKQCDHGSECLERPGHLGGHHTQHNCIFYDPKPNY